ncbi:MAG TPA: cache domain-containing protein [Bryobacteraceae bacterium]|nr:cache domain-containing protein [Bryobacteraceae bacterium]
MVAHRTHIRIPATRVLLAMLILITPICILGLFAVSQANRAAEETVGAHFQSIAAGTASEIAAFVHDRVMDVGLLARDDSVIEAAQKGNARYGGLKEEQIGQAIQKIEAGWNTPAAEPVANAILNSPASRVARRHRDFDRRYLRITVTDARGATVAATHKTLDYYQADEDFWQKIYAGGRGGVNVTDVLYDEVTKAHYIGIGVPIQDEKSNAFLGAVDALVDVSALFAVTQRTPFGPTARLLLVKDDGTIIASPGVTRPLTSKSEDYSAIAEAHGGRPPSSGFLVAHSGSARHLVGFASTELKQDYGNPQWYVISAQSADEAFAPLRPIVRLLLLISILGLASVTLFGVYVYLHQRLPYEHLGRLAGPPSAKPAHP